MEILWQWPRDFYFGDPICHAHFRVLLMAPCVTPVIRAISKCWRLSQQSLTMSRKISPKIWPGINFAKSRQEGRFKRRDSSESNPICPFSSFKAIWKLFTKQPNACWNPFRPLSDVGAIRFEINYSQHNPFCSQQNYNLSPKTKYSNELVGSASHYLNQPSSTEFCGIHMRAI